ncbi:hypothetical protein LCGC14_1087340 [marine sediment metagenome]|uniref:Uncharacterized protein n=1 Tax=marine sediment metagenome TaxID=412755 RepID=A0A0F9MHU3_9ZZZZ
MTLEEAVSRCVNSGGRALLADGEYVKGGYKLIFDKPAYDELFGSGSYLPDEESWLMNNARLEVMGEV